MGKLGAIQFRKNLKLNTRPKKLARFRHALFLTTTIVMRDFKYAKKLVMGSLVERNCVLLCNWCTKCSIAKYSTVQNWHAREAKPQNIANHFVEEKELGNLQNCELYAPYKPPACLEGCTPFYHSKGLACKQVLDYDANNDMKLLLEYKVLGCRILVEET